MASTLVMTKLHMPSPRAALIPRTRLTSLLDSDDRIALTLLSAAPGFGKTTVLSTWLAGTPANRAVAWVSLDEGDSQPSTFWQYVVTALAWPCPESASACCRCSAPGSPRHRRC